MAMQLQLCKCRPLLVDVDSDLSRPVVVSAGGPTMTFAQASPVQSDLVMCRSDDPGSGSLTSTGGSSPVTRNSGRHDNAVLDLLFSGPHDVVLRPGRSLQASNMNHHGKVSIEYASSLLSY